MCDEELRKSADCILENIKKEMDEKQFFVLPGSRFDKVFLQQISDLEDHRNEVFTIFEKALFERNHLILSSKSMISLYLCQIFIILSRSLFDNKNLKDIISNDGEMALTLQEAIFYIHENYNRSIQMRNICKHLGISQQYLIRLFKSKLGITPLQYLNNFRISKAKDLMRNSNMTMKEITFAVGLENAYYFSRLFKNVEGITPTDYKHTLNSRSNT